MTAIPKKKFYTVEGYLELEKTADYKSEYYFGEIFAMAGGTPQHSELCSNVGWAVKNALQGKPCKVYNSNLQVELSTKGHYKYPDLTVICDQPQSSQKNKNALTNPMLIVEVLSEGTADYDKNGKFFSYRQIPSFREYVLIYSDMALVLVYTKQTNRPSLAS
jgi:Uma2 family endonuclease